jgi:phosphoribosylglycinamide formyltransferase-1
MNNIKNCFYFCGAKLISFIERKKQLREKLHNYYFFVQNIILIRMKNVALFASGSGSNVENILQYFENNREIAFPVIVSNKKEAYVHERAKKWQVPSYFFKRTGFEDGSVLELLRENKIDFIVLAGFLLKVPENLLKAYPHKIINIHPALLPKFGGKGMYGSHVHEAVVANGEKESGITIHFVNENYDEGRIIFQAKCEVLATDAADDVAAKVHALEYEYFPAVIRDVVLD